MKILTRQFESDSNFFDKCIRFLFTSRFIIGIDRCPERNHIHLQWNEVKKKTWFDWHTEYTVLFLIEKKKDITDLYVRDYPSCES